MQWAWIVKAAADSVALYVEYRGSVCGCLCDLWACPEEPQELPLPGSDLLQAHDQLHQQLDAHQDHQAGVWCVVVWCVVCVVSVECVVCLHVACVCVVYL